MPRHADDSDGDDTATEPHTDGSGAKAMADLNPAAKNARRHRKKLDEILALEAKAKEGAVLNPSQRKKMSTKAQVQKDLKYYEDQARKWLAEQVKLLAELERAHTKGKPVPPGPAKPAAPRPPPMEEVVHDKRRREQKGDAPAANHDGPPSAFPAQPTPQPKPKPKPKKALAAPPPDEPEEEAEAEEEAAAPVPPTANGTPTEDHKDVPVTSAARAALLARLPAGLNVDLPTDAPPELKPYRNKVTNLQKKLGDILTLKQKPPGSLTAAEVKKSRSEPEVRQDLRHSIELYEMVLRRQMAD